MKTIVIPKEIGRIVQATSDQLLLALQAVEPGIQGVQYEYGHGKEILETLMQKDLSSTLRDKKYPMVALILDFEESRNPQPGIYSQTDMELVICHHSRIGYKTPERYMKVFEPVLYPIYEALMENLKASGLFMVDESGELPHRKIDRPNYGRNDENVKNEFLDAIEIKDLQLSWYNPNCFHC